MSITAYIWLISNGLQTRVLYPRQFECFTQRNNAYDVVTKPKENFCAINLHKAYDNLDRQKLFKVLDKRAKTTEE